MKRLIAAGVALFIGSSAQAATITLTDPFVETVQSLIPNQPIVATEVADGVTFTLTALNATGVTRLFQTYFGGGPISGLRMGTPGGGTFSFSLQADQNVLLENLVSTGLILRISRP